MGNAATIEFAAVSAPMSTLSKTSMSVMMRRIPGTAAWRVFKDGGEAGQVSQATDGTWLADTGGLSTLISAPTRKEAARTLTGEL